MASCFFIFVHPPNQDGNPQVSYRSLRALSLDLTNKSWPPFWYPSVLLLLKVNLQVQHTRHFYGINLAKYQTSNVWHYTCACKVIHKVWCSYFLYWQYKYSLMKVGGEWTTTIYKHRKHDLSCSHNALLHLWCCAQSWPITLGHHHNNCYQFGTTTDHEWQCSKGRLTIVNMVSMF